MPVRDLYHDLVRRLLEAEGWTVTHDPYVLRFGERTAYVDLGAMALEREGLKIAVEVKGSSIYQLAELERAIGQFFIYRSLLHDADRERILYLAMPLETYNDLAAISEFQTLRIELKLKMLVYDFDEEVISQWIN